MTSVRMLTHRFSAADYRALHKAGIINEDDRVELIEGEIVEMAAVGSRHWAAVSRLNRIFSERLTGRAIVSIQSAVLLHDKSMPEPDVALVIPRSDEYESSLPGPGEILLIVEVADSSIEYDQRVKVDLYARAGIPEYWIVDLIRDRFEVRREPQGTAYTEVRHLERGETVAPLTSPDCFLGVEEIIPLSR